VNINKYDLTKVTDVYRKLLENPSQEYYFLIEDKKPVKVTKIERTHYTGKICDVDVPNNVMLVRRDGTPVWARYSVNKLCEGCRRQ
jgi:hypothetical protein